MPDFTNTLDPRESLSLRMAQQTWKNIIIVALPLVLVAWGGAYALLRGVAVSGAEGAVASYMHTRGYSDVVDQLVERREIQRLVRSAVPVGTVVSWPGDEEPDGWASCRGQAFDSSWDVDALRVLLDPSVHGKDQLPDFRGLFLRGVDSGAEVDPDHPRRVGSTQSFATARPHTPFKTASSGGHHHQIKQNGLGAGGGTGIGDTRTGHDLFMNVRGEGKHEHSISEGGDAETRPVNAAINWIIRVR